MSQDDDGLEEDGEEDEHSHAQPAPPSLGGEGSVLHDCHTQVGIAWDGAGLLHPAGVRELIHNDGPLRVEEGVDPAEPLPTPVNVGCTDTSASENGAHQVVCSMAGHDQTIQFIKRCEIW